MDNTADLRLLLASRHPLVLVDTADEGRFLGILREAASALDLAVWTWSRARGLTRDGGEPMYQTRRPEQALDFISQVRNPSVFVLADAHPYLEDPLVARLVKETASSMAEGQTLILTAPHHRVPPELADAAHRWTLHGPDRAELRELLSRTLRDLGDRGFTIAIDAAQFDEMVATLDGLSAREAGRLIQRAALADGKIAASDIPALRAAKAELLAEGGILELIASSGISLHDVGGFGGLKDWLEVRRRAKENGATALGLDTPRGILLTGIPGCGKSLAAKALAVAWERPLVLLDPARLYSKYIGESEERMASALAAVDAMAPIVLWIDEIEKGFAAGGEADGGVSTRLLGSFLRWMQDRDSDVFIVATANDVSALPPEFLRKGRFDEIFFVDLPEPPARRAILATHLARRGQEPGDFDLDLLVDATEGFSGAEIETAVVAALYRAVAEGQPLTEAQLLGEIDATIPLSVSRAEEVAALRAWAAARAVPVAAR